MTNWLYYSAH